MSDLWTYMLENEVLGTYRSTLKALHQLTLGRVRVHGQFPRPLLFSVVFGHDVLPHSSLVLQWMICFAGSVTVLRIVALNFYRVSELLTQNILSRDRLP